MTGLRKYIPISLLAWTISLFILGLAAGPVIQNNATQQQLARNVLLSAIPFILIFAAIVLFFIALIVIAARAFNHRIPTRIHRPIEIFTIGGIIIGITGMFQPWWFPGFRLGFFALLISTLAFILWSHIIPKGSNEEESGATG